MAQQVIPAAQLVPRFHTIGRCNNYALLQSISCSLECKIVGKILLDHPLSYALTTNRTVSNVPGPEDTIKFMLNTQEFIYTVDMFRDILYLLVETLKYPFVAPANIETIEAFMNRVGNQYVVDKGYETVFMNVDVSMNQPKPVVSTQGMHMSIPSTYRTPTLTASPQGKKRKQSARESTEAQENIAKVQEKFAEEEIEKMVEGEEDEESYASEFADSVLNDDVDDSSSRLEPRSHKENPEKVDDDDVEIEKETKDDIEIEKENKDDVEIGKEKRYEEILKEKNNDNKETDKVVKEKDIVDDVTGSMEIKKK
nr:hypothetical protein [Tanacetum cinerariifolium]